MIVIVDDAAGCVCVVGWWLCLNEAKVVLPVPFDAKATDERVQPAVLTYSLKKV